MLSSAIYSLWASTTDDQQPDCIIFMVSRFSWAIALFAAIPEYAIVDTILALWTLVHIHAAITFGSVYDAHYKKSLMEFHRKIAKYISDVPLLVPFMTLWLTVVTAHLGYQAYHNNGNSRPDVALRAVISFYTLVSSIFLQKLSLSLAKIGVDRTLQAEQEIELYDIANWKPPPHWTARLLLAPLDLVLRPDVAGAQHISPDHPSLYVTNHARYGLEMGSFVSTVYQIKNVFLRGLSDRNHFGQVQGEFLRYFGGVNGTRKNVDCLMETRQNVLVYPGGMHEILKPSTVPKYGLMWKERLGFVRMAIKHGYPIVPCCSVGTEDMIDILFDVNGDWVREGLKIPILSPIILPHRLQKVYFWFGEPIPTVQYKGDWKNDDFARDVRDQVRAAVEAGIQEMQRKQANDPNRFLIHHIANSTKAGFNSMVDFFCKNPFGGTRAATTKTSTDSSETKLHKPKNQEAAVPAS